MVYKAIGFDRTGVIVGETATSFNKKVSGILGVSVDAFKIAYRKYNQDFNTDKITTEELWSRVLKELNKLPYLIEVLAIVNKPKEVNSDVITLIKNLRDRGYRVGLLSNDKEEVAKHIHEVEHLDDIFDVVLISSETGLTKPNKEAYLDLISKLETTPDQLVFIDDSQVNLDSAKELGITSVLCLDHRELQDQLEKLGVL